MDLKGWEPQLNTCILEPFVFCFLFAFFITLRNTDN